MGVQLGKKYVDEVTKFEGTAVVTAEYLYGTTRVQLDALDDEGKLKSEWFDAPRLIEVPEEN